MNSNFFCFADLNTEQIKFIETGEGTKIKIWNKQVLLRRVKQREDRAQKLIDMFLDGMPDRIERLSKAVEKNELGNLRATCHEIKGVASNIGAENLAFWCQNLESIAQTPETQNSYNLAKKVRADFSELLNSYQRLIDELKQDLD